MPVDECKSLQIGCLRDRTLYSLSLDMKIMELTEGFLRNFILNNHVCMVLYELRCNLWVCFRCFICNNEVQEDESAVQKRDSKTLLARFNEQIHPLYELLQECEDVKLAPELLEPEPVDIKKARLVI